MRDMIPSEILNVYGAEQWVFPVVDYYINYFRSFTDYITPGDNLVIGVTNFRPFINYYSTSCSFKWLYPTSGGGIGSTHQINQCNATISLTVGSDEYGANFLVDF